MLQKCKPAPSRHAACWLHASDATAPKAVIDYRRQPCLTTKLCHSCSRSSLPGWCRDDRARLQ